MIRVIATLLVKYNLDYYYLHEANQFAFFRIPKLLFTDSRFNQTSTDAKLLYGLMLDRMGLSIMNKWLDDLGRVFIYFTLEDACELMNIAHGKAVKLFAELDSGKGVGLIERKKQGQGRPTIIYLKNFASAENTEGPPAGKENPDFRKAEVKTSQNRQPRLPKTDSVDFRFSEGNKTEYNNTERINPSISGEAAISAASPLSFCSDPEGLMDEYRDAIYANIEYELLAQRKEVDVGMLNELVELMVCTAINQAPMTKIGSQDFPTSYVRKRLLGLDSSCMEYVMDSLRGNTAKVRNIKAYMLAALFNAPATMENYYSAEVQHDLYGA